MKPWERQAERSARVEGNPIGFEVAELATVEIIGTRLAPFSP